MFSVCNCLFLIFPSFDSSGRLNFLTVAFPGSLQLPYAT